MHGPILRHLRETKGRSQADVARSVGMSAAQLARLERNQRGLYLDDFVRITEALGEKPGNLLPNDLGDLARFKPVIDRLAAVRPALLPRIIAIVEEAVRLAEATSDAADAPAAPTRPARRRGR